MSKITILLSICALFLVVCHGVPVCPDGGCPHNDLSSSSSSAKKPLKNKFDGFLLLGGSDGNNYLDNVEAYGYNLSLPSLPSLPLPLYAPITEMTESGAIYLAGGETNHVSKNGRTFMLSNLSSSKWEEVEVEARMPYPVHAAGSVVVGDIVLVLGGWTGSGNELGSQYFIQMLNTSKPLPTWKLLNQTLPERLYYHSAAVYESQVIIVTKSGVTYTTSVSSIISDTQLDWVEGKLPGVWEEVWGPSIEVCEGKLVAVYGTKVFTKTTMDSQWVQLEPLPQEKWKYPSIGSVRGNIVIGGGREGHYGRAFATVFMWLEASSEWEEVTSLKIPRFDHATVQLHRGSRVPVSSPQKLRGSGSGSTKTGSLS